MLKRVVSLILFVVVGSWFYVADRLGLLSVHIAADHTLLGFLATACAVLALQQVFAIFVTLQVHRRKGPEGEIRMLTAFLRVLAGLGLIIAFLYSLGVLKTIGVMAAGFAGLLLGWSLQAPVSGLAAWIMVTLMRPFRVSDRVLFPSLGLTGDVKRVGMMYTVLDQVGGAIGSEEAIGRDVLIPNAMLFSQVAINYTPQAVSSYFLDEVVIRMTYDSDWDAAEKLLLGAARTVTAEVIKATGHEPYIRSDIWDYGILLRLRYMTMAKDRPRITHEIVKLIFKEVQSNPRVDMAIPYVYSYRRGSAATERRLFPEPEAEVQEVAIADVDGADPLPPGVTAEEADVAALMKNIQENGLLQPIMVSQKPDRRYLLAAGHLRFLACRRLGWQTVPALLRK